uniref:Immunoglobulin domain-containing protein n=1 Tax=Chelonoidis abingdonii TaxID=106734 RepID=A0A8C0H7M9_CHEAB
MTPPLCSPDPTQCHGVLAMLWNCSPQSQAGLWEPPFPWSQTCLGQEAHTSHSWVSPWSIQHPLPLHFHIPTVGQQHGGNYSCSYRPQSEPFVSSQPSDTVELVVAGREFTKPTIWVSPSRVVALGGNVTIRCEGWSLGLEFFLRKARHPNLQVRTVPAGKVAEFPIPNVGREDGGSYTCNYHSIADQNRWSYPSDPVEITVGEPSYPKPSISVSPGEEVLLGTAVTIRCWGQHPGVQFVLNKEGRHFPPADSDGLEVEFSTNNVHRDLGGSYTCSCHSRSEPFAVSYPSDPMELVVRGEGPSISLSPTGVTAPGANVTIRCQGQRRDVRFFLHKAGDLNPQRHMDPAGARAEFRIPIVGWQHGGNYSCSYRPRSEPFISSQPSDTMELVVAGEGPGSASPLPAATSEVQPAAHGCCCFPGGSEPPAPLGLTSPIIAGVSAAAAVLLLLLLLPVAFVCWRRTRASECPAQRGKG